MNFPRILVLSFSATLAMLLAGCALSKDQLPVSVLKPDAAFTHKDLQIKAWKSAAIFEGATAPEQSLEILVAGPRQRSERWIKLRQGQSFGGLTLESVDIRGDDIGDHKTVSVPVLIEDFSLKIESGVPMQYLILRD